MKTMIAVLLVIVFLVMNLGFNLQFCEAAGPYDPWSWGIFMQRANPGGLSWGGAPQSGMGYRSYGYNYFDPYNGPTWPRAQFGFQGSLGYYNMQHGMPYGNDGVAYGSLPMQDYYRPGTNNLFGLYGYGQAGGWRGAWN